MTVETTRGRIRACHVVVAAGAWAWRVARTLGVRLPLQGGKGYAVEWEPAAAPLRIPVYLHDQRCVANPMHADRTRVTGGLLLGLALDEQFDGRRVEAIAAAARTVLGVTAGPRLAWRGLRPCTPDGLPVIGAHRRAPRAVFATGHGMLGVTLAPLTGRSSARSSRDRRRTARWRRSRPSGSEQKGQRRWAVISQARESNATPSSPVSWAAIVAPQSLEGAGGVRVGHASRASRACVSKAAHELSRCVEVVSVEQGVLGPR